MKTASARLLTRSLLGVALTCLSASVLAQAQEIPRIAGISARQGIQLHRIELPPLEEHEVGWQFTLEIFQPNSLDLDMAVFPAREEDEPDERGVFARKILTGRGILCASTGFGAVEQCRFLRSSVLGEIGRLVWLAVDPVGRGGETEYAIDVSTIRGPWLQGTDLFGDDVTPDRHLGLGETGGSRFGPQSPFAGGLSDLEHLWEVALEGSPAKDILIEVEAVLPDAQLQLKAYDSEGDSLGAGRQGSRVRLLVPNRGGESLFLLVSLPSSDLLRRWDSYSVTARIGGQDFDAVIARVRAVRLGVEDGPIPIFEDRDYFLELDRGDLALVSLVGRGFEIEIRSGSDLEGIERVQRLENVFYSALGDLAGPSGILVRRLREPRDYLIRVRKAEDAERDRRGEGKLYREATLEVQTGRRLQRDFLLSMVGPERELLYLTPKDFKGTLGFGKDRIRLTSQTDDQGVAYIRISVSDLEFLQAGLDPESQESLDLAFCTASGEVLDIGTSLVKWWQRAPGLLYGARGARGAQATEVLLVVFSDPWSERVYSGEFSLELTASAESAKGDR